MRKKTPVDRAMGNKESGSIIQCDSDQAAGFCVHAVCHEPAEARIRLKYAADVVVGNDSQQMLVTWGNDVPAHDDDAMRAMWSLLRMGGDCGVGGPIAFCLRDTTRNLTCVALFVLRDHTAWLWETRFALRQPIYGITRENRETPAIAVATLYRRWPQAGAAIKGVLASMVQYNGADAYPAPPTEEEDDACAICYENVADVRLKPCGHVVVCTACAQRIDQCTHCRVPITSRVTRAGGRILPLLVATSLTTTAAPESLPTRELDELLAHLRDGPELQQEPQRNAVVEDVRSLVHEYWSLNAGVSDVTVQQAYDHVIPNLPILLEQHDGREPPDRFFREWRSPTLHRRIIRPTSARLLPQLLQAAEDPRNPHRQHSGVPVVHQCRGSAIRTRPPADRGRHHGRGRDWQSRGFRGDAGLPPGG